MHRIDGPGHQAGQFTEGDPGTGTPATTVTADWLNAVQEEIVYVIETAGLTLVKADNTQLEQAIVAKLAAGGLTNQLMNGAMRIWQRGTSFTTGVGLPEYTADRWRADPGDSGQATISRQAHTVGQTDVVPGTRYFLRYNQTTGSSGGVVTNLQQRLESTEHLQGLVVTVSAYLKADAGTTVTPYITQNFGSGGSGPVVTPGTAWSVTTSWQRFTWTITVPSTNGKTIGTEPYTAFELRFTDSWTGQIDVDNVQVVVASGAVPYQNRDLSLELALCQRYFAKSYNLEDPPGTVTNDGACATHESGGATVEGFQGMLPMRMNGGGASGQLPTVKWYSPATGTVDRIEWPIATDRIVSAELGVSDSMHGYPECSSSPGAGENQGLGHWTAEQEL
jgi:hypothetical protein